MLPSSPAADRNKDAILQKLTDIFARSRRILEIGCLGGYSAIAMARDAEALAAHGQSAHMAEFQKVMAANPPVGRDLRRYETDEGTPI